mmetsp:Transcript_68062/g.211448  ORF Transcript_68062/g.211448 Transcript_68062/m.211448 type:complete len:213 (+) Transcript_68062:791-1429(+)
MAQRHEAEAAGDGRRLRGGGGCRALPAGLHGRLRSALRSGPRGAAAHAHALPRAGQVRGQGQAAEGWWGGRCRCGACSRRRQWPEDALGPSAARSGRRTAAGRCGRLPACLPGRTCGPETSGHCGGPWAANAGHGELWRSRPAAGRAHGRGPPIPGPGDGPAAARGRSGAGGARAAASPGQIQRRRHAVHERPQGLSGGVGGGRRAATRAGG